MKTTQIFSPSMLAISALFISSCGTFVEKDGKTALEISAIQPGQGQIGNIDVPTDTSVASGTKTDNPTSGGSSGNGGSDNNGSSSNNGGEGSGGANNGGSGNNTGGGSGSNNGSGSNGGNNSNGGSNSGSSSNNGSGSQGGSSSSAPIDCSGQVVSFVRDTYDDFSVWMPFSGGFGQTEDQIVFNAKSAGYYEFYVSPWGSGDSEQNESFYFQVINGQNPKGSPTQKNCDAFYVVKDQDNQVIPASDKKTYAGTFYVSQGENNLLVNHFCEYFSKNRNKTSFQTSQCVAFHEGYNTSAWPSCKYSAANTGCLSNTANGITLDVSSVCVKPVK